MRILLRSVTYFCWLAFAMIEAGDHAVYMGVTKSNLPPSAQAWGDVYEQRKFVRDEATLSLIPAGGQRVMAPAIGRPDRAGRRERWDCGSCRAPAPPRRGGDACTALGSPNSSQGRVRNCRDGHASGCGPQLMLSSQRAGPSIGEVQPELHQMGFKIRYLYNQPQVIYYINSRHRCHC
jgi:hypothetical protein